MEQIKESVRNELKIEETGSSEIKLRTYHVILVCVSVFCTGKNRLVKITRSSS
jgi:hypothetical protein